MRGVGSASKLLNPSPDAVVIQADLVEFLQDLERASGADAEQMANQVVQSMGANVEELARKYAPVRSGALRDSISMESGFLEARVTASARHAVFIEFGTWSYSEIAPQAGTYEIRPIRAKALRFESQGRTVYAKSVQHPGIRAQPFMRPALAETIDEFTQGMGNVGVALLMGQT